MFIDALLPVARKYNLNVLQLMRCIMKMWHTHTMEYYSAAEKRENRKFAGKWIELSS